MNREIWTALKKRIMLEEGLRLKPYKDTMGILTIGYGRNLESHGISEEEALYLLQNDLLDADHQCARNFPWYINSLSPARQTVLADLAFQLGIEKLKTFDHFLGLMSVNLYSAAAADLLTTAFARECPERVKNLARILSSDVL